jgi:histidine triad (HIT) family protein
MEQAAFDPSCDFCQIAAGQDRTVELVCEGKAWLAFFPLEPATPGHTLVIPRNHVADLWSLDPTLGSELMAAVVRVGRAIQTALVPEGMNLISSSGAAAEQSVFHLHLHIVPRWRRDGFGRIWPLESTTEQEQIDDVADLIRAACSD